MFRILLVLIGFGTTAAFSVGAGEQACDTMVPLHRMAPQFTDSPYTIQALDATYSPGEAVTGKKTSYLMLRAFQQVLLVVSVSGPTFRGFMVQAFTNDDVRVGSFVAGADSRTRCDDVRCL